MFGKVLALILAIAQGVKPGLDSAQIKAAILAGLRALQTAAALTPGIWDDLLARAAILLVESPAWDLLLEILKAKIPAIGGIQPTIATSHALEGQLASEFYKLPGMEAVA